MGDMVMINREALESTRKGMTMFDDYDAGLLNDYGGGNVEWWQDYIRHEIARCNEFWREQVDAPPPAVTLEETLDALVGAKIVIESDWSAEGRDPCNNDNYCRVYDILTRAGRLPDGEGGKG